MSNFFCDFNTVYCRRRNPAGISCALSARIKSSNHAFQRMIISYDPYRRRGSALHSGKNGKRMRKTSNFLVKIFHPIHQRATDLCRKNPRQVCLFIRTLHTWLMSLIPDFCFGLFLFFSGHTPVKIPVSLYRNFPFSCFVSCLFQFSLECNSRQADGRFQNPPV